MDRFILYLLYFTFPFNVLWAHFHEVRRLMTRFHWSLFCACSSCKFRLASSSCILLLQVFLGLPGGRGPGATTCWVFPKISVSSLLTKCPNHPNLLTLSTSPNSLTPHLLATSALLTRFLHVTPAIYLSILLPQLSNIVSSRCSKCPRLPPTA